MTDTQALIAKLEAATEGSRELDTEIAEYIGKRWDNEDGFPREYRFSRSLDAAVSLIPKEWVWGLLPVAGSIRWICYVREWLGEWPHLVSKADSWASTPALAICIAAIKAGSEG